MIQIQFPDTASETTALGFLAGRYAFRSFGDGKTLVPEAALGHLASQGLHFSVEGKAVYNQCGLAVRDSAADRIE